MLMYAYCSSSPIGRSRPRLLDFKEELSQSSRGRGEPKVSKISCPLGSLRWWRSSNFKSDRCKSTKASALKTFSSFSNAGFNGKKMSS